MSSNPARNFEIFKTHFFFLVVKYVKFECSKYTMYFNTCTFKRERTKPHTKCILLNGVLLYLDYKVLDKIKIEMISLL